MLAFNIRFSEEKNQLLKVTRGIGFEEIMNSIEDGNLLDNIANPSRRHMNQRIYVVKIQAYVYAVPYVIDLQKQEIFLKTLYPSRVLTKKYMEGVDNAR